MDWEQIKDDAKIIGFILGLIAIIGICISIVIGIPTAAIVWIIEAIKH